MRLLVQFEVLESAGITISEFTIGELLSRVFICGSEHWVEVFEKISIDVPYGEMEDLDQKIEEAIRKVLANYPITRNLTVWTPLPMDVQTTI